MYATDTPRRLCRQICYYRMPATQSHCGHGYVRLTGGPSFCPRKGNVQNMVAARSHKLLIPAVYGILFLSAMKRHDQI